MLKTLDKVAGLVKNARVHVVRLRWNAVEVALPRASGVETLHTIGRGYFKMAIKPGSPIVILRKQLPLKHAYAISVNKSQGQTLAKVLFDARVLAFSGGQQYVVCACVSVPTLPPSWATQTCGGSRRTFRARSSSRMLSTQSCSTHSTRVVTCLPQPCVAASGGARLRVRVLLRAYGVAQRTLCALAAVTMTAIVIRRTWLNR